MKNKNKFGIIGLFVLFLISIASVSASPWVIGNVTDGVNSVGGAFVNISQSGVEINSTTTLADGLFNLSLPAVDFYDISISKAGFNDVLLPGYFVMVDGENNLGKKPLAPLPTYELSGFVLDQNNATLSGAALAFFYTDNNAQTGTTNVTSDNTGAFKINASSGTYNLKVSKPSYVQNYTINFQLNSNKVQNFTIWKDLGVITGRIVDQDGNNISGAKVSFNQSNGNTTNTTTDANGIYSTSLVPGAYDIEVEKTGYLITTVSGVNSISLGTTTKDITAQKTAVVSGTTTPASSIVTFNQNGTQKYQITSDGSGNFVQTVITGVYEIVVSKSGYYSNTNSSINATLDTVYSTTLNAVPAPSTPSSSSSGGGSSFDMPIQTTSASHSYSWTSLPANQQTGIVFNNLAVRQITFELSQEAKNAELRVEKNDEKPVGLPAPQGTAYAFLKIDTKNLNKDAIKYAKFNFEVKNEWLNGKSANPDSVKLLRFVDNSWVELSTKKTGQASDYTYYESNSPGFSYFAIVATGASTTPATPSTTITSPGNNEVIVTPGNQQTTPTTPETGSVPPITGNVPGASGEQGKPIVAYVIIGLLIIAAIAAAVYYTKLGKGNNKKKNGKSD